MNDQDLEQLVQIVTKEVIKKINLKYEPIKDHSNINSFIEYLLKEAPNSIYNINFNTLQHFRIIGKLMNTQLQINKFQKSFLDHDFNLLNPHTLYSIDLINESLEQIEQLANLKTSPKIQFSKDRTIIIQTKKITTTETSTTLLDLFVIFIHLINIYLLINFNNHRLIRFDVTDNKLEYELRKPSDVKPFYTTTIDFTSNQHFTVVNSLIQLSLTINDLIHNIYYYNKETILNLLKQGGDKNE